MNKRSQKIIYVLALAGIILSAYLLYLHYQPVTEPCGPGESMHCGEVNTSPYANLDGIFYLLSVHYQLPVPDIYISAHPFMDLVTSNAFMGMMTMLAIVILTFYENLKWIRVLAVISVIYGGYLFFVQYNVLQVYCLYCLMLDGVILGITATAWWQNKC